MDILIIIIITTLIAVYISLPFFRSKGKRGEDIVLDQSTNEDPVLERLKSLNTQKENLYSAIREIEFDYGLGKLSKEDFEELNSKYKIEAASVLRAIDTTQSAQNIVDSDDEIEQEIMSFRKSGVSDKNMDHELEQEISSFRAASPNYKCSKCGAEHSSEDVYCSKCGVKLT